MTCPPNICRAVVAGFGTAFDTLGSQARGAGDGRAVRNWAALAAVSLSLCCLPAVAVLLCGRPIASALLSQDAPTSVVRTNRYSPPRRVIQRV
jgi:Na+-driven multidrug efflux pump